MGGGSSGGGGGGAQDITQKTTSTVQLPSWAEPYAQNLLSSAGGLTSQPYSPYPYIYQGGGTGTGTPAANPFTSPYADGSSQMWRDPTTLEDISRGGWIYEENKRQGMYEPLGTAATAGGGTTGVGTGGGYYKNIFTGETQTDQPGFQSLIAPMNQQQLAGLQGIQNWAFSPSQVLDTASQDLTRTMAGDYLYPESNPYLSAQYNVAAGDLSRNFLNSIMPQLNASAQRAGAFGGSSRDLLFSEESKNLGKSLGDMATNMFGDAYNQERTRQMQAQMFAPTLDQAYLPHYQAGIGVGDVFQQQQQQLQNEMANYWQQQQGWPYSQLSTMAQILPAAVGSAGTTSGSSTGTTAYSNPYASGGISNILGGAASGAGLGLMGASLLGPVGGALGLIPLIASLFK